MFRFFEQRLAVRTKLGADGLIISDRSGGFRGDEMEERARAFNMPKEPRAKTLAGGRAFDKARDVGEDQFVIGAQIRLECSKGIVRHFTLGVGELLQ